MKYLSRNDLETIGRRVIAAYKKLPAISGQAPERIDIDYLCQGLLGLRVDYARLSLNGEKIGLTSSCEVGVEIFPEDPSCEGDQYYMLDGKTILIESELIQVTKEVFQTYRRTKWNIEDSTERFFKHETQMSSLIGGENEGYERFHEFIDYENTPENQAIEEMVFQSLRNVLDLLPPKDYELVYELYFKNRTERECAQRLGMSQQAVHERKKRILKKIKNNLDEEGC